MTEVNKIIDIYDAIGASDSDVFESLSVSQKLILAAEVRKAMPTGSASAEIANLITAYRELATARGGAFNIPLFDMLMIAAQARVLTTAGIPTTSPSEAFAGVKATASLTIGGETDSDIEEGDIISIGGTEIKAAAADAEVSFYEFNIADDKDEVLDNIIACLNAIPGKIVLKWTAAKVESAIVITAREVGLAGNSIEVSVTSDGDTAFATETLTGGLDAVEQTQGVFAIGADGGFNVKSKGVWIRLLSEYTIQNGAELPTGLLPDVLHIETGVITADLAETPLTIEAPAGYDLEKMTLKTGTLVDPLTAISLSDDNGDVITGAGSYAADGSYFFYPIANAVHVQGELNLYLDDNAAPGFEAVFTFRKSKV